jgi:hypothetical protein
MSGLGERIELAAATHIAAVRPSQPKCGITSILRLKHHLRASVLTAMATRCACALDLPPHMDADYQLSSADATCG